MTVTIDRDILFELIKSHSELNEAEYHRDSTYDNNHPSYKAETAMIGELDRLKLINDYIMYHDEKENVK